MKLARLFEVCFRESWLELTASQENPNWCGDEKPEEKMVTADFGSLLETAPHPAGGSLEDQPHVELGQSRS